MEIKSIINATFIIILAVSFKNCTRKLLYNFSRFAVAVAIISSFTGTASAVTKVATFDSDIPGAILTEEYLGSHGIDFPNGVEVAIDPTTTSGNNVIRPLKSGEFNREHLTVNFSSSPSTVSLQVKEDPSGHSSTFGQDIVITMTAWAVTEFTDIFGRVTRAPITVGSDVARFTSGAPTLATLSTNYSSGIDWIEVNMTLGGVSNNLYLLADWIQVESDSLPPPLPEDTSAPEVLFNVNPTYTTINIWPYLIVRDDRRISTIQQTITHTDTGFSHEAYFCGTAESGVCPETRYSGYRAVSLWDEGEYLLEIRACDSSGNCRAANRMTVLDLPDAPPAPASVSPWRLEINQGVQSELNDISHIFPGSFGSARGGQPFLPGKNSVIRWYLLADGADRNGFTANMEVFIEYSDGTDRRFTLSPNTTIGVLANVPEDPLGEPARNQLLRGSMRPNITRTLNFVIPGTDLIKTQVGQPATLWPTATSLQVKLRGVSGDIRIPLNEPTYLGLNIYKITSRSTGPAPTDTQIDSVVLPSMKNIMPVTAVMVLSRRNYRWGGQTIFNSSNCQGILRTLWWDFVGDSAGFSIEGRGRFTTTLAVISPSDDGCNGVANRPGYIAVTRIFADTASHEVGHNIGLAHVDGSHGEAGFVPWPYPHGSVGSDDYGVIPLQATTPGLWSLSLIDPCKNASAADLSDRYPCTVDIDGDGSPEDNQNTHELMSYGSGPEQVAWPTNNNKDRWPSKITYNQLYSGILSGILSGPYAASDASAASIDADNSVTSSEEKMDSGRVDSLMIGGLVQEDGQVDLMPLMRKQLSAEIHDKSGGPFRLRLLSVDEQVLYDLYFDATPTGDTDDMIQLVVPYVDGINRVLITKDEVIIADKIASPHAPTVQVLEPNGGEIWSKGIQTVRWIGGDADGDVVTYMVQYSPDGGASWQGLGHRLSKGKGEITFDTNDYIPGRKGLIRIIATDGINITIDDSDRAFSVGTNEIPIGFSKLQVDGADTVGIALSEPTEFSFKISYANPDQASPVRIFDTVPAEFEITEVQADAGIAEYFKANGKQGKNNGATKIVWNLTANEREGALLVKLKTVVSPGKKNGEIRYKPMTCGLLSINDGAKIVRVDKENGKELQADIYEPTNSLKITAIEGGESCNAM